MNILLTSVGRRAYMVKFFKEIIGDNGKIHVCNSDDKSVAFKYADEKVITPLIYDDNYIPFLLQYCENNSISIIVSLFDIDLLVLSKHKKNFEAIGTKVIVSDEEIVSICNDKWKTYNFLVQNGFRAPKSYLKLENVLNDIKAGIINYPIIVKPRFGCGSISISIANDEADLKYLIKKINREIDNSYLRYESSITEEKIIFQEYMFGQEFGADLINDLDGNNQNVIIRKKIAMRSGETDIAELVNEPEIKDELIRLASITRHVANMDCDVFLVNGIPYILEMNARFGGGYPFSHMGGCNLPKAIINWVKGEVVPREMLCVKIGITGYKEIYITKI